MRLIEKLTLLNRIIFLTKYCSYLIVPEVIKSTSPILFSEYNYEEHLM